MSYVFGTCGGYIHEIFVLNMACLEGENGSLPWGKLIFTHDNKPVVLMRKTLVTLGRTEGAVNS